MKLKSVMTPCPWTLSEKSHPKDAVDLMTEKKIRHLPVVTKKGELLGVVSYDDAVLMLSICLTTGYRPSLHEICSQSSFVAGEESDVNQIIEEMINRKASCVLVKNSKGVLSGIFTFIDVCKIASSLLITNAPTVAL